MALVDELVVTQGNAAAFNAILGVTDESRTDPVRLVVHGPRGCGKTTALRARGVERNLLSTRTVVLTHPAELMLALSMQPPNEDYLDRVGTADVLMMDGLETAFANEDAPRVVRMLLAERNSTGKSTVLVCDGDAASDLDWVLLQPEIDEFDIVEVEPLDAQGRADFALRVVRSYATGEDAVTLSDDCLQYLASAFDDAQSVRTGVRYLVSAAGFPAGHEVSVHEARELMGC